MVKVVLKLLRRHNTRVLLAGMFRTRRYLTTCGERAREIISERQPAQRSRMTPKNQWHHQTPPTQKLGVRYVYSRAIVRTRPVWVHGRGRRWHGPRRRITRPKLHWRRARERRKETTLERRKRRHTVSSSNEFVPVQAENTRDKPCLALNNYFII